jgi:diadenosine tetraphosphate (Ap4A) HIT family hydrolase
MWISSEYPKFEGHALVVPTAHIETLTADETNESLREKHEMIVLAQNTLQKIYPGCGVEIFAQNGPGSESSVPHVHWHVVPAQPGDLLRSFAKLGHFYTTKKDEKLVVDFPVRIRYAREELREQFAKALGSKVFSDTLF